MAEEISEEQRKAMEEKLKNMSPEEIAELQKQQCIFCQIISGKVPSKKVYEDDICIVVLDINPASMGHCLILPKQHYAIMPQVPENELNHMFKVSKAMSQILLKSMRAEGTNIFVANGAAAGQKAPHFMVHLIPRNQDDGLFNYDTKVIESEVRGKIEQAVGMRLKQLMGIEVQTQLPEHEESEDDNNSEEEHDRTGTEENDKVENLDDLAGSSNDSEEKPEDEGSDLDEEDNSEDNSEEDTDEGDLEEETEDQDDNPEEGESDEDSKGQEEHEDNEDDVDASLDDIANLFK